MKTFLLQTIKTLNTSKYFAGMMMLVLNLGSRFLVMELSESQEQLLSNKIIRRFVIFGGIYFNKGYSSFISSNCGIYCISFGIFNENSRYCIVTKPVIKQVKEDDYKEKKLLNYMKCKKSRN